MPPPRRRRHNRAVPQGLNVSTSSRMLLVLSIKGVLAEEVGYELCVVVAEGWCKYRLVRLFIPLIGLCVSLFWHHCSKQGRFLGSLVVFS